MTLQINRVAVIGFQVGAGIAAHLTNVGVPVLLLEVVPFTARLFRDRAARRRFLEDQYQRLAYADPSTPNPNRTDRRELLMIGDLEDDFDQLAGCDWIIDAMPQPLVLKQLPDFAQRLAQHALLVWIKLFPNQATSTTYPNQGLMKRFEAVRKPEAIISNAVVNTTGFPVRLVAQDLSADFQSHFLGTLFATPVRFTMLLELVPTPVTAPAVVDFLSGFAREKLGRAVVVCQDLPDLVNNRLMTFLSAHDVSYTLENNYSVEAADALTGVLIGRPDITLTFPVIDTVGPELLALLSAGLYPTIPDDPYRKRLRDEKSAALFNPLLFNSWLGAPQTFYKDQTETMPSQVLVLNLQTFQSAAFQAAKFDSLTAVQNIDDLGERLKTLLAHTDRGAAFARHAIYFSLAYAAYLAPKVVRTVADLDTAARSGSLLHWAGPFEIWDRLGVAETAQKMEAGGFTVAAWVKQMLTDGRPSFYSDDGSYDFETKHSAPQIADKNMIVIDNLRQAGRELARNEFARLLDMGDGVGLLEFHKNPTSYLFSNTIDAGTVEMIHIALARLRTDFDALVVGNTGRNFSSGANIAGVVRFMGEGKWKELSDVILSIGDAALKLRHAPKPVVTAPHHFSVGAGTVLAMTGWQTVAALEINLGFAEAKLGVIAAAGGCKETLRVKVNPAAQAGANDLLPVLRAAFQQLATSKLSNTAWEAQALGYLRATDTVLVNSAYLLAEAKRQALQLVAAGARPPNEAEQIYVAGANALAALDEDIHQMVRERRLNEYEARVVRKTAVVMCGGEHAAPGWVRPESILEMECEAFMSLLGEEKSRERLTLFVQTGRLVEN